MLLESVENKVVCDILLSLMSEGKVLNNLFGSSYDFVLTGQLAGSI